MNQKLFLVTSLIFALASSYPQRSDWFQVYSGDSKTHESPVNTDPNAPSYQSNTRDSNWHQNYDSKQLHRRSDYANEETGEDDGILAPITQGLKSFGKRVVSGFTKLTGIGADEEKFIAEKLQEQEELQNLEHLGHQVQPIEKVQNAPLYVRIGDKIKDAVESVTGIFTGKKRNQNKAIDVAESSVVEQYVPNDAPDTSRISFDPNGHYELIPVASNDPNSPQLYELAYSDAFLQKYDAQNSKDGGVDPYTYVQSDVVPRTAKRQVQQDQQKPHEQEVHHQTEEHSFQEPRPVRKGFIEGVASGFRKLFKIQSAQDDYARNSFDHPYFTNFV